MHGGLCLNWSDPAQILIVEVLGHGSALGMGMTNTAGDVVRQQAVKAFSAPFGPPIR
jgi:hypothetical protein